MTDKIFHVQLLGRHYYISAESEKSLKTDLSCLEEDAFNNEGVDQRLVGVIPVITELHVCDWTCFVHEWL